MNTMNTMNVTDGTFRAWCLRCGMKEFVGIEGNDFTLENVNSFIFNVTHGYIGDRRGGCLQDASMMIMHPQQCAECGTAIARVVPVIPDRDQIVSEFEETLKPENWTQEFYLRTPLMDAHLRVDGSLCFSQYAFDPGDGSLVVADVTFSPEDVVALTRFLAQNVKVPALPDPDTDMFKDFVPIPVVLDEMPSLSSDRKKEEK